MMNTYFLFNSEIAQFWTMEQAENIQHAIKLFCSEIGLQDCDDFDSEEWKVLHQSKVRGYDAIEVMRVLISTGNYEARTRWCLRKYQDGCEENRIVTIEEAEAIANIDPSLIYLAETFLKEVDGRIYRFFSVWKDWQCELLA